MKLLDALQDEHALIDRVLGSFRSYVDALVDGMADAEDGARFAAFFSEFAGHFHHDREERVFFHALITQAELPAERGPVHALAHEHAEMAQWLREMTPLLERGLRSDDDRTRLQALATRYSRALWRHIDAENSVLYPQGAERLARWLTSTLSFVLLVLLYQAHYAGHPIDSLASWLSVLAQAASLDVGVDAVLSAARTFIK